MMRLSLVSLSVLFAIAGCDPATDADAGTDAPVTDVPTSDVPVTDAPVADVTLNDAPPDAPTSCLCEADQTCFRGVCIATCEGLEGLDAALADGVVPVSHSCRGIAAVFDVVGTNVYELEAIGGTDGSTTMRLVRWSATDGDVTTTTIAQRVYTPVADPAELVFPGYVAVSDDEAHVLFGYTTSRSGFIGGVVDVDAAAMTFEEISAPGNFDGAFVDGSEYLINGIGFAELSGQALYLADASESAPEGATVVDAMGDASGSVALWAEENLVVFGGANYGGPWPDGSSGGYVFFLPSADVLAATAPIDAFEDAQRLVLPGAFELLTGGRLIEVYYGATGIDGLRYYPLTVAPSSGTVSAGDAIGISTGGTFTNAGAIGDDVLLVHGTGSLRVTLP